MNHMVRSRYTRSHELRVSPSNLSDFDIIYIQLTPSQPLTLPRHVGPTSHMEFTPPFSTRQLLHNNIFSHYLSLSLSLSLKLCFTHFSISTTSQIKSFPSLSSILLTRIKQKTKRRNVRILFTQFLIFFHLKNIYICFFLFVFTLDFEL